MEVCQICNKICSGNRGLSLHMYQNKECLNKLTNMTKQLQNYLLRHSKITHFNLDIIHQNKKL